MPPKASLPAFPESGFNLCPAHLVLFERIQIGLDRDLQGWMRKLPTAQPSAMPGAPGFPVEPQIAAQQESLDPDAVPSHVLSGRMASADQVTQGFVQGIRYPDVCQLARAKQSRQRDGVASIILYALSRLSRGQ